MRRKFIRACLKVVFYFTSWLLLDKSKWQYGEGQENPADWFQMRCISYCC